MERGDGSFLPALLTGGLGFFAGWTAGSVPLTLAGAPFALLWISVGTALLGAALGAWCGPALWAASGTAASGFRRPDSLLPWLGGAGLFLLAAGYFVKTSNALPLWGVTLVLSVAALLASRRAPLPAPGERQARAAIPPWAVGLLALGIVALYVLLHRPDADDSFYLNLPLGLQQSAAGMMVEDSMYGEAGWPILGSNYRVEALPTLTAALAWASGLSVIAVAHGLLPLLWCLAWALTLAVIGRAVAGERWWIFAVLSILATMAFGGTLQTWGTHGVTRLFHGKGPLLLIVVPLIVHTVLLAQRSVIPVRTAWILLALLEIAALGLTANAIYIAPLTLGLALAATFLLRPDLPRSLILLTPAVFPLLAGLWIMFLDPPVVSGHGKDVRDLSLWDMASRKQTLALLLLMVLGAALAARFVPQARIVTAFVLASLVLVVNPVLWPFFERNVTGGLSFRIWWALPVPMLLALGLTWLSAAAPRPNLAAAGAGLGLAAMAFLPSGLIGMDGTALKPSLRKLPPEAELARQVAGIAGDTRTLAPEAIATWLPVLEPRPPLVFSRRFYLDHSAQVLPAEKMAPRILLADWIDGLADPSPDEVGRALAELCVETLVLPQARPVDLSGATPVAQVGGYAVLRLAPACR